MRILTALLTVATIAIAIPASAQQLHIDTPVGDVHVGQGRDHNRYREPSDRVDYGHNYDRRVHEHDQHQYQRVCREIEFHDHHGNHQVRRVCD